MQKTVKCECCGAVRVIEQKVTHQIDQKSLVFKLETFMKNRVARYSGSALIRKKLDISKLKTLWDLENGNIYRN